MRFDSDAAIEGADGTDQEANGALETTVRVFWRRLHIRSEAGFNIFQL